MAACVSAICTRPDEGRQQSRSEPMDLKNKVAIVTGGGSGLGEATAIKLATGGAKVAVLDLNADVANAVAERIGGRAVAIDIADAEAGETAEATNASGLGTTSILCS